MVFILLDFITCITSNFLDPKVNILVLDLALPLMVSSYVIYFNLIAIK